MFAFIHRSYLGGSEDTTDTDEKKHHRDGIDRGQGKGVGWRGKSGGGRGEGVGEQIVPGSRKSYLGGPHRDVVVWGLRARRPRGDT